MGGRLFTDKLASRWLEVLGFWSLDSATPATSAYPVHASGSPPLTTSAYPVHASGSPQRVRGSFAPFGATVFERHENALSL